MKKSLLPAFAFALTLVCQSKADLYDFTFTESASGPTTASGQIDVVSGFATSGYLDVTGGFGMGHYDFVVASGTVGTPATTGVGTTLYKSPADFFLTDGAVFVDANPFLTEGGLLFSNGVTEFNFFFDGSDYELVGSNGFRINRSGVSVRAYAPQAVGSATLTAVPESGATLAMLGATLLGFASLRRRLVS